MSFLQRNNAIRPKYLPVRGKALKLPIYFPSISSVKTNLAPFDYFSILIALRQPQFLVSAFDIDKSKRKAEFLEALKTIRSENGSIVLMDSGNYESYWLRDGSWNRNAFNEIVKQQVSDLAFCYDNQFPSQNSNENVADVEKSTEESQRFAETTSIVPIVHCKKEKLPEIILELYNKINFTMVSIPERILGDGIIERVRTVTRLRRELSKLENYVFVHLLGTGNPFALLLFSMAGADTFDGLEWCQTTVDSNTGLLHHFQHRDLIKDNCDFCENSDLDYTLKTLGHNLHFYNRWMGDIQDAIESNKADDLLQRYFNANVITELNEIWK